MDSDVIRCSSSSIRFDETPFSAGSSSRVYLKEFTEACSYIQCLIPFSPGHPYFTIELLSCADSSKVVIGIASNCLRDGVHVGCYTRTLGYHSDTGLVISSHVRRTQTKSPVYGRGDKIGVLVTDFGRNKSSVTIVKNGRPVCTQYHHERDHSKFYPTISLERGPIELLVAWPLMMTSVPRYHFHNLEDWIVMPGFLHDKRNNSFCQRDPATSLPPTLKKHATNLASIQSPEPLSPVNSFYEVTLIQKSLCSKFPSLVVCLVACGAHLSAPSSALSSEVLKFPVNTEVIKVGDKLGWGIHYLSDTDTNGSRLVICCATLNGAIQTSVCYAEPDGGYYPFVVFTSEDFRVRVNTKFNSLPKELSSLRAEDHRAAFASQLKKKLSEKTLSVEDVQYSKELNVHVFPEWIEIALESEAVGIHTLQYISHPLSDSMSIFQVNITQITEDSVLCVGLAPEFPSLTKHPGRSQGSIGYHSKDGKILYDGRSQANTQGHRFSEGDQVIIEVCTLPNTPSAVLIRIWKNDLPIALRYLNTNGVATLYPTVSMLSNGSMVKCEMVPPNLIEKLPAYFINDPLYWCLPPNSHVITEENEVILSGYAASGHCIVCPVPMSRGMHHFEVIVLDDPADERKVPPMVALTTASPYDPPRESNFRLDLLRFWPRNEAASLVRKGDKIGWGVIFPEDMLDDREEQIVLCYLTINRDVILTRALIQPAGGLHATVVMPYGCDRVRLNFDAVTIKSHPFTRANVLQLYREAQELIEEEKITLASGLELPYEHKRLQDFYKPLPSDCIGDITPHRLDDIYDVESHFNADSDNNLTESPPKSSKPKICIVL